MLRTRIVSSAIRLFAERGIDQVTVEEIAEAADVGKGTIYNYFQTKEDLVVAFMADFEREVQAEIHGFDASGRPLADALATFIRVQLRMKERHHAFVRVFLAHMFLHTERFLPYMVEMQKTIDPPMETLFRGLQESGLIRVDVDLPDLITVFKTIQMGLTALWAIEGPPFRGTERALQQEIRLFCQGLEAKS